MYKRYPDSRTFSPTLTRSTRSCRSRSARWSTSRWWRRCNCTPIISWSWRLVITERSGGGIDWLSICLYSTTQLIFVWILPFYHRNLVHRNLVDLFRNPGRVYPLVLSYIVLLPCFLYVTYCDCDWWFCNQFWSWRSGLGVNCDKMWITNFQGGSDARALDGRRQARGMRRFVWCKWRLLLIHSIFQSSL